MDKSTESKDTTDPVMKHLAELGIAQKRYLQAEFGSDKSHRYFLEMMEVNKALWTAINEKHKSLSLVNE